MRFDVSAKGQSNRTIPSLDGLRGVAVLLVIAAHTGFLLHIIAFLLRHRLDVPARLFQIDAGDLGVSVFFVISGFLITTLLLRNTDAQGRIILRHFYLRRFFRIFPPYYVYLLVVTLLWAAGAVPMLRGALVSAFLYGSNYYPYQLSQPGGTGWLVGHTWSLSLEEQFYLLWPVSLRWLGKRRSAWLGVALLALAPAARVITLHAAPGTLFDGQIERMFHTRIDTIVAGCVLALLDTWPGVEACVLLNSRRPWTGLAAGVLLYGTLHASWRHENVLLIYGIGAEAVLLAFLLRYAIDNAHTWGGRLLNHRWLRRLGVLSYSVYLWQQLFDGPMAWGRGHGVPDLFFMVLTAELSYRIVERSSFRLRDWFIAWQERKITEKLA